MDSANCPAGEGGWGGASLKMCDCLNGRDECNIRCDNCLNISTLITTVEFGLRDRAHVCLSVCPCVRPCVCWPVSRCVVFCGGRLVNLMAERPGRVQYRLSDTYIVARHDRQAKVFVDIVVVVATGGGGGGGFMAAAGQYLDS